MVRSDVEIIVIVLHALTNSVEQLGYSAEAAHRISYRYNKGELPEGQLVRHGRCQWYRYNVDFDEFGEFWCIRWERL
jgi:hypothetical protein